VPTTLESLLRPKVIAVLGASRDPHKWGQRVIRYTRAAGFSGDLLAINPMAPEGSIPGATVLQSIGDASVPVDCAFLALPRDRTAAAVVECCQAGVGTIVVAASGFGEASRSGAALEQELLELAAPSGGRILGPNCFGVYSAVPGVNLTPFEYVPKGNVALVSQSGNVSAQLFLAASKAGFGFSHCVGVGNQLDVGFGDLLAELADDPGTGAVALYVEGLPPAGGATFSEGLERCRAAGKPVVVIKAGTSRLSAAVAQTHTRSMAADDRVWDAVLDGGGAVRVRSVPEMADVLQCAVMLAPSGRRVAVITDGGGDSVLALDALAGAKHLEPARFTDELVDQLEHLIPPAAPRVPGLNPLTLDTAGGVEDDPEVLSRCVDAVARAGVADVLVVSGLFGTYVDQRAAELRAADAMRRTVAESSVAVVFQAPLAPAESEPLSILSRAGIPFFESVDRAVRALDRLAAGPPPAVEARTAPRGTTGRQWSATDAGELLARHGIAMPTMKTVHDLSTLTDEARGIGYPVCVKTAALDVVHKSDVGGVRVGIADEEELRAAAASLWGAVPSGPLLVMPSFPTAFEMLVGGFVDAHFGPVVVLGRGGVLTEMESDTQLVSGHITPEAVESALSGLRCFPVLQGYRSAPALDISGLRDIAVALAAVLTSEPTIAVDLNPVLVYPDRCEIADVRVMSAGDAEPNSGHGRSEQGLPQGRADL
jgi:acetate---CoA ligase (ADP-forming)